MDAQHIVVVANTTTFVDRAQFCKIDIAVHL